MYNDDILTKGSTMYDTPIVAANKYGIGGGFLTYMYGWLTSTGNAILIGVLATLIGLVVSVVCQILKHKREARTAALHEEMTRKEDARKQQLHEAELKRLSGNQGYSQ